MKNLILTAALALITICASAQTKGDWYVGTGDISGVAWTDWSVSPSVGYGVTDNLMIGAKGYFAYVATDGLSTDNLKLGAGKLFTIRDWVYVDPKVVYDYSAKTTNLQLGFGFKF